MEKMIHKWVLLISSSLGKLHLRLTRILEPYLSFSSNSLEGIMDFFWKDLETRQPENSAVLNIGGWAFKVVCPYPPPPP